MLTPACFVACVKEVWQRVPVVLWPLLTGRAWTAMRRSPPLPAPMRSNSAIGLKRRVTDPVHCRKLCTSVLGGRLRCDNVAPNVRTPLIHARPVSSSRATHWFCGKSNTQPLSRSRCPYLRLRLRRSNATQNQIGATAGLTPVFRSVIGGARFLGEAVLIRSSRRRWMQVPSPVSWQRIPQGLWGGQRWQRKKNTPWRRWCDDACYVRVRGTTLRPSSTILEVVAQFYQSQCGRFTGRANPLRKARTQLRPPVMSNCGRSIVLATSTLSMLAHSLKLSNNFYSPIAENELDPIGISLRIWNMMVASAETFKKRLKPCPELRTIVGACWKQMLRGTRALSASTVISCTRLLQ